MRMYKSPWIMIVPIEIIEDGSKWLSGGFMPFVGTATVVARHEFTS